MNNLLYGVVVVGLAVNHVASAMFTVKLVKPVAAATAVVGTAVGIKKFPSIKQQIERAQSLAQWQKEYAQQHVPKPSEK